MWAGPSKCSLWAWLAMLLLAGSLAAEEVPPEKPGLYDGAVGIKRDEVIEKSLTGRNPERLENATLRQVVARVEQLTQLQVWLDAEALTEAGIDLGQETIVPLWSEGETLTQLQNHLSDQTGCLLAWVVHEGGVTLTTEEKSFLTYDTKQYPVGDLLSQGLTPQMLIELLEQESSGPWENDEPGTGTIHPIGNLLFVRQTHRIHQEVAEMLTALRRDDPVVFTHRSDEDMRLTRFLEEKIVSFDWPDVTIQAFTDQIQEMTGAKFRLDMQAITDAGISGDTRLEARAVNLSLFVALQHNLSHVHGTELTVQVTDEECLITTAEQANQRYETVLYHVGEWGITGENVDEFAALLELETSGPWDADEPGTGSISCIQPRSILVIRQVPRVHREILEILRDLRPKITLSPVALPTAAVSEPVAQAHSEDSAPQSPESPVPITTFRLPRMPHLGARVTWDDLGIYALLLMALLVGGASGYLGRH